MDPKLPLVRILWDDAENFKDAWASAKEADEFASATYLVISIGWLVKKNRHYYTLASDYDPNHGNYGSLRKIPKKMISKIEFLTMAPSAESYASPHTTPSAPPPHTPPVAAG